MGVGALPFSQISTRLSWVGGTLKFQGWKLLPPSLFFSWKFLCRYLEANGDKTESLSSFKDNSKNCCVVACYLPIRIWRQRQMWTIPDKKKGEVEEGTNNYGRSAMCQAHVAPPNPWATLWNSTPAHCRWKDRSRSSMPCLRSFWQKLMGITQKAYRSVIISGQFWGQVTRVWMTRFHLSCVANWWRVTELVKVDGAFRNNLHPTPKTL